MTHHNFIFQCFFTDKCTKYFIQISYLFIVYIFYFTEMIISDPENEKDDPYELFSSPKKGPEPTAKYYGNTSGGSSEIGKSETEKK